MATAARMSAPAAKARISFFIAPITPQGSLRVPLGLAGGLLDGLGHRAQVAPHHLACVEQFARGPVESEGGKGGGDYSTVTVFARFRGWSTLRSRRRAIRSASRASCRIAGYARWYDGVFSP